MVALKYLCVFVRLRRPTCRTQDNWYCNSKYSDLYEHYVNSVKLVAVVNNRQYVKLYGLAII